MTMPVIASACPPMPSPGYAGRCVLASSSRSMVEVARVKSPLYLALYVALAATLSACHSAPAENSAKAGGHRIVSLDYCADQMLLGLVPKSRIAAVSVDVRSDPLFAEPLHAVGRLMLAAGRPAEAARVFKRVLRLRPGSAAVQRSLEEIERLLTRREGA